MSSENKATIWHMEKRKLSLVTFRERERNRERERESRVCVYVRQREGDILCVRERKGVRERKWRAEETEE